MILKEKIKIIIRFEQIPEKSYEIIKAVEIFYGFFAVKMIGYKICCDRSGVVLKGLRLLLRVRGE